MDLCKAAISGSQIFSALVLIFESHPVLNVLVLVIFEVDRVAKIITSTGYKFSPS